MLMILLSFFPVPTFLDSHPHGFTETVLTAVTSCVPQGRSSPGPSSASVLDTCTVFGDNLAHFRCFCCYLFIADDSKITAAQTISLGLEHPASGYVFPLDVSQDV